MSWKIDSLNHLFNPSTIAVIGASQRKASLGGLTLRALRNYNGSLYAVNPKYQNIGTLKCFPSVKDIGDQIDLAIIALQAPQVLPVMRECAEANVRSAIIFTAGFKELGSLGEMEQERIKEVADNAGIVVIGPNCLGAGNLKTGLNATFFSHPVRIKSGTVSMASQSGGVTGLMLYRAYDTGLGVSKFVSVGNRVNIDFHDIVRYFGSDQDTDVICLFVEGTEFAREMYEEVSRITNEKPVLIHKVGKTPAAKAAALSHTGSLAGDSSIYTGAFRQARALELDSISEMIDIAKVMTVCKNHPRGNQVVIITHTLGLALIAAQSLEMNGLCLKPPKKQIAKDIQSFLGMPVDIPISNPVDLLAQGWSNPEIFANAFDLVIKNDQYDAAIIVFAPNFQEDIGGGLPAKRIAESARISKKPIIAILSSPYCKKPPEAAFLEDNGIPVFTDPQRAAVALASVIKYYAGIASNVQ